MSARAAALAGLLLLTPALAPRASAAVYRWTDASGGLHFSDTAPADGSGYETLASESPVAPAVPSPPAAPSPAGAPPPGLVRQPAPPPGAPASPPGAPATSEPPRPSPERL